MGIPGIYQEIGSGTRISLTKLSIDHYETHHRPLRLAIDISIWNFQTAAAQGGLNPSLRVLYYRLLRLLSTSIQAVFVFDGPKRPGMKRGKNVGGLGGGADSARSMKLIKLMGFEVHQAPGEAEAECAVLQKEGVVDAVLSEDVDTLMFGSGVTLRDWSSEGTSSKEPTHVSVYNANDIKDKSGLDREGMILIALMSGGDYLPTGLPKCGSKIAIEAARAGYGTSLCALDPDDEFSFIEWRRDLEHELHTNESKFFRTKHKSITIPEDWPSKEVMGFYTHPTVSSPSSIQALKSKLLWNSPVDLPGLRSYVDTIFQWSGKTGAKKLLRGLAPAVLVYKLRERAKRRETSYGDALLTAANEMEYVREVTKERRHFSTGGVEELRVVFQPCSIVPWDLDAEPDDEIVSTEADEDSDSPARDPSDLDDDVPPATQRGRSRSPVKRDKLRAWNPTELEKVWIPRTIVKIGVPLKVEDFDEACMAKEAARNSPKKTRAKAPAVAKKPKAKGGMKPGALEMYLKVTKAVPPPVEKPKTSPTKSRSSPVRLREPEKEVQPERLPPVFLAPSLEGFADFQPPLSKPESADTAADGGEPYLRPRREYWKSPPPNRRPAASNTSKPSFPSSTTSTLPISAFFTATKPSQIETEISSKRARQTSPPLASVGTKQQEQEHQKKYRAQEPLQRSLSALDPDPEPEQDLMSDEDTLPPLSTMLSRPKREKGLRRSYSEADAVPSYPAAAPISPVHNIFENDKGREREVIDLLSSPLAIPPPRPNRLPTARPVAADGGEDEEPEPQQDINFNLSGGSEIFFPRSQPKAKKKFLAPRESLPGAWREFDEEEVLALERRGRDAKEKKFYRKSGVEVLDLTGDD